MTVTIESMLRRAEACRYLRTKNGLSYVPSSLANLAALGEGPPYHRRGKYAYYPTKELDAWANSLMSPLLNKRLDPEPRAARVKKGKENAAHAR